MKIMEGDMQDNGTFKFRLWCILIILTVFENIEENYSHCFKKY